MCVCICTCRMEIWNWVILGIITIEKAFEHFICKLLTVIAQILSRFPLVLILSSNTSNASLLFLSNHTSITLCEQYSDRQAARYEPK